MNLRHALPLLLLASLLAGCASGHPRSRSVRLFDGKTFHGWEGDTTRTFRIEQGAIVGGSLQERVPRNEFLSTTRSYTNFVLKVQFKLLGDGVNGGVQIRTRRIPNHHEVSGYQADLGDPGWWGSLYDESRRNRPLAKSDPALVARILRRGQWNDYEIRCEGKRIRLFLNGQQTVDYEEAEPGIDPSGIIALQIHGGPPSEAWYRNIVISELP